MKGYFVELVPGASVCLSSKDAALPTVDRRINFVDSYFL